MLFGVLCFLYKIYSTQTNEVSSAQASSQELSIYEEFTLKELDMNMKSLGFSVTISKEDQDIVAVATHVLIEKMKILKSTVLAFNKKYSERLGGGYPENCEYEECLIIDILRENRNLVKPSSIFGGLRDISAALFCSIGVEYQVAHRILEGAVKEFNSLVSKVLYIPHLIININFTTEGAETDIVIDEVDPEKICPANSKGFISFITKPEPSSFALSPAHNLFVASQASPEIETVFVYSRGTFENANVLLNFPVFKGSVEQWYTHYGHVGSLYGRFLIIKVDDKNQLYVMPGSTEDKSPGSRQKIFSWNNGYKEQRFINIGKTPITDFCVHNNYIYILSSRARIVIKVPLDKNDDGNDFSIQRLCWGIHETDAKYLRKIIVSGEYIYLLDGNKRVLVYDMNFSCVGRLVIDQARDALSMCVKDDILVLFSASSKLELFKVEKINNMRVRFKLLYSYKLELCRYNVTDLQYVGNRIYMFSNYEKKMWVYEVHQ